MLHELKQIISSAQLASRRGVKTALVSVVDLDGSSYRRPGVRMLVQEDGQMVGAVSGGCVEKEVLRQAQSVFAENRSKLMVYDGRYRLGCEGVLYILIEPFAPAKDFFTVFEQQLQSRMPFYLQSYFSKKEDIGSAGKTRFEFSSGVSFWASADPRHTEIFENQLSVFSQKITPEFQLYIIGVEHDAVELCKYASMTGWRVNIVAPLQESKTVNDFAGASNYIPLLESEITQLESDTQTAWVVMTHSFVKDLKYMTALSEKDFAYLGLLGAQKRREKMIEQLIEHNPAIETSFLDKIHGPCGINIGAETPQEIAVSIVAEILSVVRKQIPIPLKDKAGSIHA